jgi:hypothetical protein
VRASAPHGPAEARPQRPESGKERRGENDLPQIPAAMRGAPSHRIPLT